MSSESSDERYRRGEQILQRLHADAIERLRRSLDGIAPDLARYVTEFAYGDIYARPGLGLREREIVTIAALAALGTAPSQLRSHLTGALNAGVTREEIVEILLQIAIYAGFPAALNALAVAREVFEAL